VSRGLTTALPDCPSTASKCYVSLNFVAQGRGCPSIRSDDAGCLGLTSRGNAGWAAPDPPGYPTSHATVVWRKGRKGTPRDIKYQSHDGRTIDGPNQTGWFDGTMSSDTSPEFKVSEACAFLSRAESESCYYTPNDPGVPAGEDGGPLYWDFRAGDGDGVSTQITIRGVLYPYSVSGSGSRNGSSAAAERRPQ
jgi:hypothetical protein